MSAEAKPSLEVLSKVEMTAWDDYEHHCARAFELYKLSHKVDVAAMRLRWTDAYNRFHEALALSRKGQYP